MSGWWLIGSMLAVAIALLWGFRQGWQRCKEYFNIDSTGYQRM